ncbi:Env11p [Saccharomyces cerevisiae YJM1443]|nr:Env11p [Saccharomyces cerevisiae YJM1443]
MNTALDDLHGDLVTLEDNEIINNSDHSSSHSTSHEEEDEEEDDTEDIELIEKDGNKILSSRIHPEDEIINDGLNIWIPVQMLKKNIAKFWSHFLAIEKKLTKVKCKHCGEILTRSDASLTKTFRSHLKTKHNISANKNFYSMNFTVGDSNLKNNTSSTEITRRHGYDSLTFNSDQSFKCFDIGKLQSSNYLSISQLVAIVIASENLPLNFFENVSFKSLLSKFHRIPPLTTNIIEESIIGLSKSIDELIRRSISRNDTQLPFTIHLSDSKESNQPLYLKYSREIRAQLSNLDLSHLISVNFTELAGKRSLFSLQLFDNTNKVSKVLPLSIFVRKTTDIDISVWQEQLNNLYSKYPGLQKSVISITLPQSHYTMVLENRNSHNFTFHSGSVREIKYHTCIVSELLHCFLQPLFNVPTESMLSSFSVAKENHSGGSLLDSLIDFSHIDLSSTILGKICCLIEEVNLNDSLKSDFLLYCQNYTQPNCNELTSILSCNCDRFSALKSILEKFANLVPFFKSINSHLENESLSESDFRLINTVEETLRTFEQSIEYFASSAPLKFTHTLVFIINFELYLTEIIRSFKFTKSKKPFEKILARLLKVKDLYLLDDVNLIGAFLYPSIFQSKSLLNEIFGTTSVNKIVHNMTKIVLRYLKNFINITNFRSSNSGGESGRNSGNNLLSDYEAIFMKESRDVELLCNTKLTAPLTEDSLLVQIIRDDLLRYVNRIAHELPNAYHDYLNDNDISFDGCHFTKHELSEENDSNSGEWCLNPMEETFDIHIPISDSIWNNYISSKNKIEVIDILLQLLSVNSTSSIRSELSSLTANQDFSTKLSEETIKIKLLNSQFNLEKINFHSGSIFDAC